MKGDASMMNNFRKVVVSFLAGVIISTLIPGLPSSAQSSGYSGSIQDDLYVMYLDYEVNGGTILTAGFEEGYTTRYIITGTVYPGETISISGTGSGLEKIELSAKITCNPRINDQPSADVLEKKEAPADGSTSVSASLVVPEGTKTVTAYIAMQRSWFNMNGGFDRWFFVTAIFDVIQPEPADTPVSNRTRTTPTLPVGCVDTGTRFSDLSGKVDVAPFYDPEDFDTAGIDMVICVGDRIRTGRKSSAILSMGDLSTYVMKPETTIILDAPLQHDSKIKVVAGNIWINIKKTLKDGSMEVIMNEAVCGIKGTTLIAEETGSESRLKVIEGAVAFKSLADGESLDVSAGETIAGTGEGLGEVEVFDIAAEEAEWQEYLDGDRYKKNFFDSISASIPVMAGAGLCGCLGIGGLVVVAVVIVKRRRKAGISQSAEQQPESGTIYCIQCGKTNQPGAAFCRNCGRKLA
jgi:hypothetical protein